MECYYNTDMFGIIERFEVNSIHKSVVLEHNSGMRIFEPILCEGDKRSELLLIFGKVQYCHGFERSVVCGKLCALRFQGILASVQKTIIGKLDVE